jgi:hypothetical protein
MTTVDDRLPTKDLEVEVHEPAWSTKVRLGPQEPQVLWCAMSVTAVRRMGALGAHRRSRERPERTLHDVSARLRFGRYQMKSGRSADISKP